jgi:hypothetical protein
MRCGLAFPITTAVPAYVGVCALPSDTAKERISLPSEYVHSIDARLAVDLDDLRGALVHR